MPCSWMLFRTVTLVFPSGTVLMAIYIYLRRLQAKTMVQTGMLDELLYAYGMNDNGSSETKMQGAMDQVSQSCDIYDPTISTKSQRSYTNQHLENRTMNPPSPKLKIVDKFIYLGSTLSRAVHIDDEVTARIAKASVAFGRLCANVWERNGIKFDTKLRVYKAVGLPTLLCAFETWTVYQRHAKILNHSQLSCMRKLLKSSGKTRFQTQRS